MLICCCHPTYLCLLPAPCAKPTLLFLLGGFSLHSATPVLANTTCHQLPGQFLTNIPFTRHQAAMGSELNPTIKKKRLSSAIEIRVAFVWIHHLPGDALLREQFLVWALCPSGALHGRRSSAGGSQHGVERPQWQLLLQETSFLFRCYFTAGYVHAMIFHLPLPGCLGNVSDRRSWLSKKTPKPFVLAKVWLADLIAPQSERHILIAFALTRGCGHPRLSSDLQKQGRVHQEEAVAVKNKMWVSVTGIRPSRI